MVGLRYFFGDDVSESVSFVTPIGVLDDPTLYDWRDDLDRLRAADPAAVAATLVDDAQAGDTFLLIERKAEAARGDADTEWQARYVETSRALRAAMHDHPELASVDERDFGEWHLTTLRRN